MKCDEREIERERETYKTQQFLIIIFLYFEFREISAALIWHFFVLNFTLAMADSSLLLRYVDQQHT
jgi:hypothetical protein